MNNDRDTGVRNLKNFEIRADKCKFYEDKFILNKNNKATYTVNVIELNIVLLPNIPILKSNTKNHRFKYCF